MHAAATSFLGFSQLLLISLNAFFNKEVITKATGAHGFSIVMGRSKRGSFDQLVSILVTDPVVKETLRSLGQDGLYDLLKWIFLSGVGIPYVMRNRKAKLTLRELRQQNDDLQEKLDEAFRRVHRPIKTQGLSITVMKGRKVIAEFNDDTLNYLEEEVVEEETSVETFAVSRFNARTSTGRFISSIDSISFPFYPYDDITDIQKQVLSGSLDHLTHGRFEPVPVIVSRVTSRSGQLKKYLLHDVPHH